MTSKKELWEKELVEACVMNDRLGQEKLYRHFFPNMLAFVRRYTDDPEQALEIINNGFLRVFKKIHLFEFKGSLEGWIRKLIFHSIADYFKNQSKSIHFLVFEDYEQPLKEHTIENFYAEDLLKMVAFLPNATQEVFRLYAIEGYAHAEIAAALNISVGTSKWHLSEARKKLKELLYQHKEFKHYVR